MGPPFKEVRAGDRYELRQGVKHTREAARSGLSGESCSGTAAIRVVSVSIRC